MQEDEKEQCFYQISNQSKNLEKDDSSYSQSSQNTKSFDSAMAHLLENAIIPNDDLYQYEEQIQRSNQENINYNQSKNQTFLRNPEYGRIQQAEDAIRSKQYMYISYIQPDSSFKHQIKLINRNVKSSARTKEMLIAQSNSPKYLQSFANSYQFLDQGSVNYGIESRNSSQNQGIVEGQSKQHSNFILIPQQNKQDDQQVYNPQKEKATNSVRASQLDYQFKYQSNNVIDEQQEEEQAMTTSQFRDKRLPKSKNFKSKGKQFSLEFDSLTPSGDSISINKYSFAPNSEVAKIFGLIPSSTTSKRAASSNQTSNQFSNNMELFNGNTFDYTRKLYLIIVLNPNQFMVELKQLKMFYEPLELVSMKVKRQGGGNKTLVRKLDINLLSERLIKSNEQSPAYKIKTIHIPIKDQVVNPKKDGAWAQIKKNMENFYESIESILEYLNGKEQKPLEEIKFDNNLFDKGEITSLRKQFNFPPFVQKQKQAIPKQKQFYSYFYDNLLQKISNLNDIPYSDLDMNQNLLVATTQSLEYINLTDVMFENNSEETSKLFDFEYLKQKILNTKQRQKSSYEPRKIDQSQQSSLVNSQNKSLVITDSEKRSVNQFNPQLQLSQMSQLSQPIAIQEPSNISPILKRQINPFVPYQQRNQNEQLYSDSKKAQEEAFLLNKEQPQNQDSLIESNPLYGVDIDNQIEDVLKNDKNQASPQIQHYKQTENKVFLFTPIEENQNLNNRNSSCRNSSSQKGKLSPLSRYKNQQQFDKNLIQRIQKQAKKISSIKLDNTLDSIAIFPRSVATSTASRFNSNQIENNQQIDDKIVYPFKSKWIKLRKNSNGPRSSLSNKNNQSVRVSSHLNAYERMKLFSGQEPQSNIIGGEKSLEFVQQNPISQTLNINNPPNYQGNQLHQSHSFQPNSQSFEINGQQEEDKIMFNQFKQTYDLHPPHMNQTFNNKLGIIKKQEYKRTIINQVHDAKFAEQFHKQFLLKFGFNSSRQISEILYKDAFFNYSKEELDIMFGQFLILANSCQKFMEKPLQEFLQENEQKEQISTKQKTIFLFQKCLFTKLNQLKESFPVFKRLKDLQVLKPALKFILLNNELVDQHYDSGKEGELQIYWKEFLRFKAFIVEQKWSRYDKISFLLSIINPNNEQNLTIKQINAIFPDNMKIQDPKQIRLMKEFLFNSLYLVEGSKVPFTRISDCLQKEFFLNINDLINHFLQKQ